MPSYIKRIWVERVLATLATVRSAQCCFSKFSDAAADVQVGGEVD